MGQISVFLADDQELVRYALRTLFEAESDITVVGEAHDSDEAISGCVETNPNVLLLELRLSGAGGVEVCREVHSRCPNTAVLALTSLDSDEEESAMLNAGACGYLLKDTRAERVVEATRSVAAGQSVFDIRIAEKMIHGRFKGAKRTDESSLSERETEVLELLAKGLTNKEIGRSLWIGEATVKTHVSHILRKLGATDRTQAVLAGVKMGLVRLDA